MMAVNDRIFTEVETIRHNGMEYIVWEDDELGDEAPYIITDSKMNVLLTGCWNGFEDFLEYEECEC